MVKQFSQLYILPSSDSFSQLFCMVCNLICHGPLRRDNICVYDVAYILILYTIWSIFYCSYFTTSVLLSFFCLASIFRACLACICTVCQWQDCEPCCSWRRFQYQFHIYWYLLYFRGIWISLSECRFKHSFVWCYPKLFVTLLRV